MKFLRLTPLFIFITSILSFGQTPKNGPTDVAQIIQDINHLNTLGSVMYFAAHPDDENQRVIGYFARYKGYETAYTALTRGDGGQNLIGKEIREGLGILRSQELIEARKVDGGNQFFSRANDFGYSKNPEETLSVWNKDQVLADAVWNIRKFRPDIIITRFSPDRGGRTHGHHTTSAIIAVEAFKAAADPKMFPEQLEFVSVWQPKRVIWNTNTWFFRGKGESFDPTKYVSIECGEYIPVLGKSVGEIAMAARSKHKCQGFGAELQRGSNSEYFKLLDGDEMRTSPMEGVDTSWERVENADKVAKLIKKLQQEFNPTQPNLSINTLVDIKKELSILDQKDYWVIKKSKTVDNLILLCSGMWIEALSPTETIAVGDSLKVEVSSINRSATNIVLKEIKFGQLSTLKVDTALTYNRALKITSTLNIPSDYETSQPYWLVEKPTKGMYVVNDQQMIGKPENDFPIPVTIEYTINNTPISVTTNIWHKKINPAKGERYIPLAITPPVTLLLDQSVWIFGDNKPKTVNVDVLAHTDNFEGDIEVCIPKGWKIEPATKKVTLKNVGDKTQLKFTLYPSKKDSEGLITAMIKSNDGKTYMDGLIEIDYDHIYKQRYFKEATSKVIKLEMEKGLVKNIGYIMGAGDAIPESLEAAGYNVEILDQENIKLDNIKKYDAIIVGIRAYNVLEKMRYIQPTLLEYTYNGGTVIVQYNTSFRVKVDQIGPYPLKLSRDRITVEESPVEILAKNHKLVTSPNKITLKDFDGWVQERGLYYPNEWSEEYTAVLRMKDPNEKPVDGALIVADYGKGAFIYSGISWFRELPYGVSGAYRLFANLLDYKPSTNNN
ncbi:PIG-L family deacetylase [Flammeovirga pectinis]|uniref:PIG-L family deacetylase n=1 Tax=Flammeovirga pectinis TaxID=2494373 RepID=A0A3Q9FPZ1_9BACT|nr:PIG-L family deacetylase [Flammeovirga pectinis]AZQ62105.1 PIG-L family deacetylase [Flammeovirga pectinis]